MMTDRQRKREKERQIEREKKKSLREERRNKRKENRRGERGIYQVSLFSPQSLNICWRFIFSDNIHEEMSPRSSSSCHGEKGASSLPYVKSKTAALFTVVLKNNFCTNHQLFIEYISIPLEDCRRGYQHSHLTVLHWSTDREF